MDTIVYENEQYEAPGGPASYCSFTARKQKHDVNLYTKFGRNYPLDDFLKKIKGPNVDTWFLTNILSPFNILGLYGIEYAY